ncbi:MAG: hypothetical protein GZ091_09395 [Paludibacter sp.]|nr:hypothetical protein [Paludibacter sp.]
MKKIILLISVIFLFSEINAEESFKNGYIITLENDTVFGKIANSNYYGNSIECIFKENNKDETVTFLPNQLSGYRFVDGKYYISQKVLVDSIPTTFFMEYLIKGKLNIFFRHEKNLTNHYYAEKDNSGLRELIYKDETVHNEEGWFSSKDKKYIGLLTYFTSDCETIRKDIPKIDEPDHKKLIKFGKKYNDLSCPDNACLIYEKKMFLKIKVEAFTSTTFPSFSTESADPSSQDVFSSTSTSYSQSYKNLIQSYGFNVLFSNKAISERIFTGLGVVLNKYTYSEYYFFGEKLRYIDKSYLSLPISVNYLNPKKGFSDIYSFAFDLLSFTTIYNAGVKYQLKKTSLNLTAGLNTVFFVLPYTANIKFGVMYEL